MAFLNEIKKDLTDTFLKSGECGITCFSDKTVVVEGHRGLYFYDENLIKVKIKGGCGLLAVNGKNLKIEEESCAQLVISGKIISIILDGAV